MSSSAGPKILHTACIAILLLLTAACAETANTLPPPATMPPRTASRPSGTANVILHCGDAVQIRFLYASQFDQNQTVRPDGKIQLQLLGEVAVQGKTPEQLRDELMRLYAVPLKHPQLAVIVKGLYYRRVYVGGEVQKPGPVPMPGEMTALEAVMDAGGFKAETAEARNVIVVRNIGGRMVVRALDLKEPLDGKKSEQFYLEPRDVVFVPQTHIANVDLWFQQHLWRILPPLSVGYSSY